MPPAFDTRQALGSTLSVGVVEQVHTATFTAFVRITNGRSIGSAIECLIRSFAYDRISRTGIIFIPNIGDQVYIDWSYAAYPVITDAYQDVSGIEERRGYKTQVLPVRGFGGEDPVDVNSGDKFYRWGPTDLMPGDKVIMGTKGNMLGVLAGGLTILKGGELSQLILSDLNDSAQLVARNFELFTDFGQMRMVNDSGRLGFELLGNATDVKSNKHMGTDWDYVFKLGGQNLMELLLMKDKFQFVVNPDGQVNIKTAKSFSITMGSPPRIEMTGNTSTTVKGNKVDSCEGQRAVVTTGIYTEKSGQKRVITSGALNSVIGSAESKKVMGRFTESVRGTSVTDTDTVGYETLLHAGDYSIDIGNPVYAGVPSIPLAGTSKTGSYNVSVFLGDISLLVGTKGDITFGTKAGDIEIDTLLGDVTLKTVKGDATLSTEIGAVSVTTKAGDAELSTLKGDIKVTTALGDVTVGTELGTLKLSASPDNYIELSPTGVTITNKGVDLVKLLGDTLTALTQSLTPGYSGPLSNLADFAQLLIQQTTYKGA